MGVYGGTVWQMFVQFLVVMFVIVGAMGLATGVGLLVSTGKTMHVFHTLNRWISTRHVLKPVEIPHQTDHMAHRFARWVAGGFVVGGLVSIFGLTWRFDVAALSAGFAGGASGQVLGIAIDCVRWFLIIGAGIGVAVGIMLLVYPNAEATLERYANMWVSSRKLMRHGDDMNLTLDRLVEANPKPSGWVIACTSAAAVIYGLIVLAH